MIQISVFLAVVYSVFCVGSGIKGNVLSIFNGDVAERHNLNCTGPNEYYACGSACQVECKNLGCVCHTVNVRCNDACYCKDDYARSSSGLCIPKSQCPPMGACPEF